MKMKFQHPEPVLVGDILRNTPRSIVLVQKTDEELLAEMRQKYVSMEYVDRETGEKKTMFGSFSPSRYDKNNVE